MRTQLISDNQNWNAQARGVSPDYLHVKAWPMSRGGMFDETDVERASPVCVLGQTVVDQLFGEQDPLGETIRVKNEPCKVVGVLRSKGQSATGQDQDDTLFMPYTTISNMFQWPTRVSPAAIGMAVAFSASIGVFFGFYPARRASALDPIEALRHE